ncbi:MAG TPA: TonB-dependent receptor [Pyrinomonadaceae bacterium]|jgi:outer membrane receptor protein involved in Fe transport|nr:TonB-dependent receptor [Pyrinomonadaceae bacterium]
MRTPVLSSFPRILTFAASLILTLLIASNAGAQTQITTGTIQGTVVDANGAVVPGANVEIKNLGTNFSRTLTTDDEGRFVAPLLQPGNYSVTVSKQGFATTVLENTTLTVGQALSIPFSLKISSVAETVTITTTPTVDTVKTEASTTVNEATVSNTPVLGRKFEDLLTLTPNVSITQGPDGDEINFSGQRGIFNNVSLDGGDYNNGFFGEQLGGQRAAIDISLEAVREFQVVASGASAEFGRTAGGVINVITKSGTNDVHGSAFYFQRLEALTANTSDGRSLDGFNRKQYGGTIGGPIKRDRAFYFFAFEGIREKLNRANLSEQIGTTPCPIGAPTIGANEGAINANDDCARLALLGFFRTRLNQEEGLPVEHKINNQAFFSRVDFDLNNSNHLSVSYNFDYSKNTNQTFDVATYGNSANGIEGPSKINVVRVNLFTTVSPMKLNEAHFSYSRELRPRAAVPSNVPADTAMGFATTFRFGFPFFLEPNVDELLWRTHAKDSFSIITGDHNFKFGGEWLHTLNDQVFRGFFTGRYIFDSPSGFLRYASTPAANGFGPNVGECFGATGFTGWITQGAPFNQTCPAGSSVGGPLLLYLQNGIPTGISGAPPPGKSTIKNEDLALFVQDRWQLRPNFTLNYGLRWEAQIFPEPVVPPSQTVYASLLNNPRFPSDGTLHSAKKEFQPRLGFAWDLGGQGKSVIRAHAGIFYGRQNMLSQVGSITDNGVQQFGIACGSSFGCSNGQGLPSWPGIVNVPPLGGLPAFASIRVFSKDYANPRIYTANVQFEQQLAEDLSVYFDFTHSKGVHLTRFINLNRVGLFPGFGDVFVTSAVGRSVFDGFTVGMRKRFTKRYQFEWNYAISKDKDDDSNERDPFTDRSFDPLNLSLDYALSDRDIRHKFNFFTNINLGWGFDGNFRVQARSAQPITPATRTATNRNSLRKDNSYFSFDWRIQRPIKLNERFSLIPIIEMFNSFNNKNNVNPLVTPGLFNFDGFLRQGVGDPRQVQLAVRLTF